MVNIEKMKIKWKIENEGFKYQRCDDRCIIYDC